MTPSACAADGSPNAASPGCTTCRDPAARRSFPASQRLHVLELATREDPAEAGCPAGSWSLDDLALTVLREAHHQDLLRARLAVAAAGVPPELPPLELSMLELQPMSRSAIRRVLTEADLKPHRSAYWLNSHAPDFVARSQAACQLYLDAERLWQLGEPAISSDEKTGILIRRRKHPTRPISPGQPRLRQHEYIRLGMRQLSASFCVPTGQVAYDLSLTHNSASTSTCSTSRRCMARG